MGRARRCPAQVAQPVGRLGRRGKGVRRVAKWGGGEERGVHITRIAADHDRTSRSSRRAAGTARRARGLQHRPRASPAAQRGTLPRAPADALAANRHRVQRDTTDGCRVWSGVPSRHAARIATMSRWSYRATEPRMQGWGSPVFVPIIDAVVAKRMTTLCACLDRSRPQSSFSVRAMAPKGRAYVRRKRKALPGRTPAAHPPRPTLLLRSP